MTGYVGNPDFHDGHILTVSQIADTAHVTVECFTGKRYVVRFEGVMSLELESPEGMMLYALSEGYTQTASLRRYVFINWYGDEPDTPKSKSYLRIEAKGFTVEESV